MIFFNLIVQYFFWQIFYYRPQWNSPKTQSKTGGAGWTPTVPTNTTAPYRPAGAMGGGAPAQPPGGQWPARPAFPQQPMVNIITIICI